MFSEKLWSVLISNSSDVHLRHHIYKLLNFKDTSRQLRQLPSASFLGSLQIMPYARRHWYNDLHRSGKFNIL